MEGQTVGPDNRTMPVIGVMLDDDLIGDVFRDLLNAQIHIHKAGALVAATQVKLGRAIDNAQAEQWPSVEVNGSTVISQPASSTESENEL